MMQILILPKISFLSFWFFFLCLLLTYLCSWNLIQYCYMVIHFPLLYVISLGFVVNMIYTQLHYPKKGAAVVSVHKSTHKTQKRFSVISIFSFDRVLFNYMLCTQDAVLSCILYNFFYVVWGKEKKLKILVACALRGKSPNRNLQSKLQKYCSIFDKGNSVDIRCLIWDILAWFLFS